MNNMFPISKVKGNELTNLKGESSYFYKIDSIDLEQLDSREITEIYNLVSNSLNHVDANSVFKFYRIDGENYLNSFFDGDPVGLGLKPYSEPLKTFFGSEEIYSNLEFFDDYINYNGNYQRIVSVLGFGEEGSYPRILDLNCDYALNIRRYSADKAKEKLDNIRNSNRISFFKDKTDFQGQGAYEQAEGLLFDIIHQNESLFEIEIFFIVKADSLKTLSKKTYKLISGLVRIGANPFIEGNSLKGFKSGLSEHYISLIPGAKPLFKYRNITDKSSHLKYLLPLHKSKLMNEGVSLLDTMEEEIFFNPFDKNLKNRNCVVTGATGTGKSVLVNKIVNDLSANHPVVILDKEGSFKKNCLYHGGYNLESKINPLDFKCPFYLREFLLSVVDRNEFSKKDEGRLLMEIREYLDQNSSHSFFSLIDHLDGVFQGFGLYFQDLQGFITDESLEQKNFLYVDIDKFPKSQVAPLIIYAFEYFKNIQNPQKILVIDECYTFLKGHEKFIDERFRQIRKSGGMAIAIAQAFSDFKTSDNALNNSITNNSHFQFFFSQNYVEDQNITEFDNQRIKDLKSVKNKFSECYLKSHDNKYKKVIRLELSPLEYELFNTEFERKSLFEKFFEKNREHFLTNSDAIDSFVRLHHGI